MQKRFQFSVLLGVVLLCQQVIAAPEMYRSVETEFGIPTSLLYAIALTESGTTISTGQYVAWPWTLNVNGDPRFFASRKEAWLHLTDLQNSGLRNIDVGPLQVSWRWNGSRFENPWSALDPEINIRTAATILVECKQKKNGWTQAVGCYHSPGNEPRAMAYSERVYRQWQKL